MRQELHEKTDACHSVANGRPLMLFVRNLDKLIIYLMAHLTLASPPTPVKQKTRKPVFAGMHCRTRF